MRQKLRKMDELLLRHLHGQTTEEENRSVEAWRIRTADAEGVLADYRRLIQAGEWADRAIDPGDPPPVEQLIWRAEARRAQLAARPRPARTWLGHPGTWITAAAAAVAGFTLWNVSSDTAGPTRNGAVAVRDFLTTADETAMVRLDDGSVVRLGPESRLTTPATHSADVPTRQVTLEGEAFFSIAADEARPFVVTTAAGSARVLGTRFHLAAQADELAVVVVEGRVALAGPNQEVEVGAGQATRLVRGSAEPVADAPPIEEVADWLRGFLIFHDTPLAVAMREVGERYGVEFEIDDSALKERTLTMWFNGKSLEEVMTVVCSVIDAHCTIGQAAIRIEARDTGVES
ncbi:MAG: FecR domain-containing protein [Gemmatimonadota bacterium]|nr:FecR domain-containing protein [Gemmatimonadota bacterium]